jgi:Winged helix DNA-binding domain
MRRQALEPLAAAGAGATDIVRWLCGVQAQVPSAAALAVAVRREAAAEAGVDEALRDRRLMRTWAMRGTLHLLPSDEAGAYLSLMGATRLWEKGSWQKAFISVDDMQALTEAIAAVLDGQTLTREELVAAVTAHLGRSHQALEEQLRSGWAAVLKPVAWQGLLCQATPSDDAPNRVRFARPDQWLPGWAGVPDPDDAARVVVPAYLRAHGPATMQTLDAWLTRNNSRKAALRGWFAAVEDDLATVEIEGHEGGKDDAYLMADDVDDLAATEPSETVRLLPGFDQYVLGPGTSAAAVVPPAHRPDVSRAAGWISPVVVAGGRVVGVWEPVDGAVKVQLFDDAPAPPAAALDAEIERVEAILAAAAGSA